jgi:hypothetical protein
MDVQNVYGNMHEVHQDTNGRICGELGDAETVSPRLMRISEVDGSCDAMRSIQGVVNWVRTFLALPHPNLGRKGAVCPFVPTALGSDTIWIAEMAEATPTHERISAIMVKYLHLFQQTEPTSNPEALNKAFLVVFPSLINDDTTIIDKVQDSLKASFVEKGLMLGEFHARNESPGLRNPSFRPLRSPVPMLAIRHMVESDLPFLTRETDPPQKRSSYLRSYLFRLGGTLSEGRFNEALDGLIAAEGAIMSSSL